MSDTNWTFTRVDMTRDGSLRHWDLNGPNGLVRFEIADALGFKTASVYLHAVVAPAGADLEDCAVCGKGWHDALVNSLARGLRAEWESAGCDDTVIRAQLERWYNEELSTPPVPVSEGSQVSGEEVGPADERPNLAATGAGTGLGGVVPVPVVAQPDQPNDLLVCGHRAPYGRGPKSVQSACGQCGTWRAYAGSTRAESALRPGKPDNTGEGVASPVPVAAQPEISDEADCPHLADILAGRAQGCHDDSTCGWCAVIRSSTAPVPVPVVARVGATAIRQALYDSLSPNFEIDSDAYDDAAVAVAKLLEPEPAWGSGPLVDHNPETLRTQREMDADLYENWVANQEAGTGSADPDGGQR